MKFTSILFLVPFFVFGQGGFKKGLKRGNDYQIVSKNGCHFSFGPTYLMSSKTIYGNLSDNGGARGNFEINPDGKLGVFAEFGLLQFPTWKGIPIKFLRKSRVMDYMEFAFGFRQLSGSENTIVNLTNLDNSIISRNEENAIFKNGHLYFRSSFHSLIFIGKKKIDIARKYFIDQSVGLNFDYNLFPGNTIYPNNFSANNYNRDFYKPSVLQFHYGLSIGIRLNRVWIILPGASLPIIGIYEWNSNTPRWNLSKMNWFSSQYNPIQFHIKFIKLFERAAKCNVYGNPNDIKLDQKFRMGN
jgi:hypothetical protein